MDDSRRRAAPIYAWRGALLGVALLAVAACTSVEFNPITGASRPAPYTGEVQVLQSLPPAGRYERLGVVLATGGDAATESGLLKDLKKEAARHGANAIMLQSKPKTRSSAGGTELSLAAWAFRVAP